MRCRVFLLHVCCFDAEWCGAANVGIVTGVMCDVVLCCGVLVNVLRDNVVRCVVVVRCGAVRFGVMCVQCGAVRCVLLWCCGLQCGTVLVH